MIEEKVLFNVLKNIGTGKEYDSAPDKEYLEALEKIGLIKLDWDNKITSFGTNVLSYLRNKIEKW